MPCQSQSHTFFPGICPETNHFQLHDLFGLPYMLSCRCSFQLPDRMIMSPPSFFVKKNKQYRHCHNCNQYHQFLIGRLTETEIKNKQESYDQHRYMKQSHKITKSRKKYRCHKQKWHDHSHRCDWKSLIVLAVLRCLALAFCLHHIKVCKTDHSCHPVKCKDRNAVCFTHSKFVAQNDWKIPKQTMSQRESI